MNEGGYHNDALPSFFGSLFLIHDGKVIDNAD